jgi:DNA-binding LytR/AlgR family response regulator
MRASIDGQPFAMAFVDVRMPPGIDGVEATYQMFKIDPRVHVVLCTAYSDHSWKKIIERLGPTDRLLILKKPFDSIEVRQMALALTAKWTQQIISDTKREELQDWLNELTKLVSANGMDPVVTPVGSR